jgi:outer membrane protein
MTGQAVQANELSAPSGFYVDVGLAGLLFDTDASIKAAGNQLPGSNLRASNNVTLGLGIGYFVTPDVSLLAVLGVPPTTTLTGQGTLSGLTLGKVTYGPSMLVANYHFRQFGAFQPFLGAGITYTVIFGTKDDAIANLRVSNSIGAVIRTGFDVMFSDRWGAFLSVSKVFVSTNASGNAATLGGAPLSAHVSFNPLILFSGITYRF